MSDEISRRPRAERAAHEDAERKKAPLILRAFAWLSVVVIFVVAGYYGADQALKMLDRNELIQQKDVVSNTDQLQKLLDSASGGEGVVEARKNVDVFSLGPDGLVKGSLKILADTQEDEIAKAVKAVFSDSSETWAASVEPRHLFRDGVSFYLDLPRSFLSGLESMPEERALLMITGIVRTVVQNFAPINRVFFLVDGRWVQRVGNIKLSEPWGIDG